jgi:hypothetical protein
MNAKLTAQLPTRSVVDGFLPDEHLASLVDTGRATQTGPVLRTGDGRTYLLEDAVRVLGCRDRELDPYGLTGLVESIGSLVRRGFVVTDNRIALRRVTYDVELGVLAHPLLEDEENTGVRRTSAPPSVVA